MSGTFLFEKPVRNGVLRLQVTEYQGRTLVSFRRWFYDHSIGELRCTKDGVTFPVEWLPELYAALGEWLAENPPGQFQA